MSDTRDLRDGDAIDKLRKLVKDSATCLFASDLVSVPLHACPMQVQQVDDEGDFWFFSGADSHHNEHLERDNRVQLFFSNNSDYEFLTVYGHADIVTNRSKAEELWDPTVKAWFPGGIEDPNLRLIRLTPDEAHYWATKNGKVVTFVKMLAAAAVGKVPDVGVQGDLRV